MNTDRLKFLAIARFACLALLPALLPRAAQSAEHPYMLWNKADIEAAQKRIASKPWAKKETDALLKTSGHGQTFRNLFRFAVLDDANAGEAEKKYLLSFIGAKVDDRPWSTLSLIHI